jgi:membrane-bound lytic murein transglycosylase F
MKFLHYLIFCLLPLVFFTKCGQKTDDVELFQHPSVSIDLPEILKKGKLTILAENSSTSFFIYRGKKMGFEYEILQEFANDNGLELDVKIVSNLDDLQQMLQDGSGDIIACNYTVTKDRIKHIDFSIPFLRTPQVLVQRKPEGWENMSDAQINEKLLRDPSQLAGKEIHVWKNSSYYQRLLNLQEEIGDTILIQEEEGKIGSEEMLELVAEGLIDYTVTEANIAQLNQRFLENLDVKTELSVRQKIAFGLRKSSPLLLAKLDNWLRVFMQKKTFKYLKKKYFEVSTPKNTTVNYRTSTKDGSLSPFDDYFRKSAKKHGGIDWQLVAAIAYQESKFNPTIVGFGGAYGMMQFMPNTGPSYGVYPHSSPEQQIEGATKKLAKDFANWRDIKDDDQRIKFTLATYNAGKGHIQDAQRLAKSQGLDPTIWDDNVEKMLLSLSKAEFYQNKLVKNGLWKGNRTHKYVRTVYTRYQEWKSVYK